MADSEMPDSKGEKAEAALPLAGYEILKPKVLDDGSGAAEAQPKDAPAEAEDKNAGAGPVEPADAGLPSSPAEAPGPRAISTKLYVALAVGLGLMVGLALAAIFLHPGPNLGTKDWGPFNSGGYGLNGHLTAKWDGKVEYNLTVEPVDAGHQAAFNTIVNSSPRPLALAIQLKDSTGTVLCSKLVLLKFDPAKAAVPQKAGGDDKNPASESHAEEGFDLARLQGQELDRERGNDIFQNGVEPNGDITSISAQGTIPCSQKEYESIVSWGFVPDFPTDAEQLAILSGASASTANEDQSTAGGSSGTRPGALKAHAAKETKRKPAPPVSRFVVEGEDAIVEYNASTGIIETDAGRSFLIDKTGPAANALKGRDVPIDIRYKCDQKGDCTLAGVGVSIQHAQVRR